MSDQLSELVRSLHPVVSRVRTDVSAVKLADGSRWTNDPINHEALIQHVSGVRPRGVCPIKVGESVVRLALLDFDSHGGETPWVEMVAAAQQVSDAAALWGLRGTPWRSSGGNGIHLYFLWDDPQDAYSVRMALFDVLESVGFRSGTKGVSMREVEVFPKQDSVAAGEYGNQFILPLAGKSVPLDDLFGWVPLRREDAPNLAWPVSEAVLRRERPAVRVVGEGGREPDSLSEVRSALFAIPNTESNSPDYDRWRDLAFAVYEATGGSDEGLALFDEWSAQNPKHDAKFLERRVWAYIKVERGGRSITRSSLYAAARDNGWGGVSPDAEGFDDVPEELTAELSVHGQERKRAAALQKYEGKSNWKNAVLAASNEFELREQVCAGIVADTTLNSIDREMLAQVVCDRFRALGVKLPIGACRKLVAFQKKRQGELPNWCEGWVYVTDADKFYRNESAEWLSMQSFNAKYNREVPPSEDGEFRKSASWVALEELNLPTVTREAYVPNLGPLFTLDGVTTVNTFRPSSVPATAPTWTPEGKRAVALVKRHLEIITGGRTDLMEVLVDWMAHNTQHPGVKIRWAPLIKGVEGDGKTLIGRVMQAVLGTANVKNISPTVLKTDFTGWAMGGCVGVLEEVKLTGHNRYDILNALKPFVTNNTVPIHMKGRDEFDTMNTMNYIAFTNWADALPLSDSDRRFFVIFTPFADATALVEALGNVGEYFNNLYDAIEIQRESIRKWLVEHKISPKFNPNGTAPMTEEKRSMIALGHSEEDDEAMELLKTGGVGIGRDVVATRYLSQAVKSANPDSVLQSSALSRFLVKNGWLKVSRYVKWRGASERVYVRHGVDQTSENLRKLLDETLAENDRFFTDGCDF